MSKVVPKVRAATLVSFSESAPHVSSARGAGAGGNGGGGTSDFLVGDLIVTRRPAGVRPRAGRGAFDLFRAGVRERRRFFKIEVDPRALEAGRECDLDRDPANECHETVLSLGDLPVGIIGAGRCPLVCVGVHTKTGRLASFGGSRPNVADFRQSGLCMVTQRPD